MHCGTVAWTNLCAGLVPQLCDYYVIMGAAAVNVVVSLAGRSGKWLKVNQVIYSVPVASENTSLVSTVKGGLDFSSDAMTEHITSPHWALSAYAK